MELYRQGRASGDDALLSRAESTLRRQLTDHAITLAPSVNVAERYFYLGATLSTLSRTAEAAREYRRSLALDPANGQTWENLGIALTDADRPAEAEAAFKRAVTLWPRAEGYSLLARSAYGAGRASEGAARRE